MKFNKYWFKPRGFGYGATPTSWEGWLTIIVFIGYVLILTGIQVTESDKYTSSYLLYVFTGVIILIIISKAKSKGKWHWSWGKK